MFVSAVIRDIFLTSVFKKRDLSSAVLDKIFNIQFPDIIDQSRSR